MVTVSSEMGITRDNRGKQLKNQDNYQPRPASESQILLAWELGLNDVKTGDSSIAVHYKLKAETQRRGRLVLRKIRPLIGDRFDHPELGVGEIVKINKETLKVTLYFADLNRAKRKIPFDIYRLGDWIKLNGTN